MLRVSSRQSINMKMGIVLHGAGIMDTPSAMSEIADAGFHSFEYSHGHTMRLEGMGRAGFKDAADHASSLDLKPVQLHGASLESTFDLGSPDEVIRRKSIERSCLWIGYCADLNVPAMVEHSCEFHPDFVRTMELIKSSFGEIARCAQDNGVKVAVENEFDPRELAGAGEGRNMVVPARVGCLMSELLEIVKLDPDNLGVCLDFGHANLQRPLLRLDEAIHELGKHLIATHIHDNEGVSDQHMTPLMGNIEWDRAMAALEEIGYRKPVILEVGGLSMRDKTIRMNRLRLYRVIANHLCRSED